MAGQLHGRFTRPLTSDEKRAAEAVFSGRLPSPAWSPSAQRIYERLIPGLATRSYICLSTVVGKRQQLLDYAGTGH